MQNMSSEVLQRVNHYRHGRRRKTSMGIVTAILACSPTGGQVARGMKKISYKGYRFPPEIIQQAIWLYLRFTLSFRDVEDLLAERGIMVSYSYCVISSYGASLCRQA